MRNVIKTVFTITISILISVSCSADISILTDQQLGDFIAEKGVCNIKISDGCNPSAKLKIAENSKELNTGQTIMDAGNRNCNIDQNMALTISVTNQRINAGENYVPKHSPLPPPNNPQFPAKWDTP